MATTGILDGRKLGRLNRFFTSTVAVQQQGAGTDRMGHPNGSWSTVSGLGSLACSVRVIPPNGVRRLPDMDLLSEQTEILLASYQSAVTTKMRAAVSGGLTYDVIAVEHDPLAKLTRLVCQKVST